MKRPVVIGLVALSVALNVAFVGTWLAHVLTCRGYRRASPPGLACGIHAQLDLSDAQRGEIEALVSRFRGSAAAVCAEAGRHRAELFEILAAEPVECAAVASKREEIAACQRRMQDLVLDHILAQKALLTPEQQAEFFKILGKSGTCPGNGPLGGGAGRGDCPGTFGE